MALEAGDGRVSFEVEFVEEDAEAGGVYEAVEFFEEGAFWGVGAPGLAVAEEFFRGHAAVGAVAVEEEVCAEAAVELVEMEVGVLGGEFFEDGSEGGEAIVVSEDVVDLEVGVV